MPVAVGLVLAWRLNGAGCSLALKIMRASERKSHGAGGLWGLMCAAGGAA
eukprot:COSAG05_NODE_8139_length_732_cov_2.028436_1_plen_49_part_10